MRLSFPALVCALMLISSAAFCQDLYMEGPAEADLAEGQTYSVSWNAGAAETVDVYVSGINTPLGGRPRGAFQIEVAHGVPAVNCESSFKLPWVDALRFDLKLIGRDGTGKKVCAGRREYGFRPAVLAGRPADGIYVDLHQKVNQRLYVQKDGAVTKVCLCSSSINYRWMPANVHPSSPHDHAGVFKVLSKSARAYSRQYDVEMPWAMQYLSGHFIHATSPGFYRLLGQPASHGCNRLTREDARELFAATAVGTRVEIIGP